nr:hypothetical protein 2 [San Bernardo virus]AQM55440.1 hypothetical protein 2 [San Bernardo virus]
MNLFSLALLLCAVDAAVHLSDVVNQFSKTANKHRVYQNLKLNLKSIGLHNMSPFLFDRDCVTAHRTNDYLFSGCELPPGCSRPIPHLIEKGWFGQETLVCYGMHPPSFNGEAEFFEASPINSSFKLAHPIQIRGREFTRFDNFRPVSFFEWFYIIKIDSDYALLPKFCSPHIHSDDVPRNVKIYHSGDELCFDTISFNRSECSLQFRPSLFSLLSSYDIPVSFDGVPFSSGSFSATNNELIGADSFLTESPRNIHTVVARVGGSYMVSYTPLTSTHLFILKAPSYIHQNDTNCVKLTSSYSNPLNNILKKIFIELRSELYSLIDFVLSLASRIATFVLSVIFHVLDELLKHLPYTEEFYTSLFISVLTYFILRDVVISVIGGVCYYSFKIYINSFI